MASFAGMLKCVIDTCHMFSTLHVGAHYLLVRFDDAYPTSSAWMELE
jgi:hypothetical protein